MRDLGRVVAWMGGALSVFEILALRSLGGIVLLAAWAGLAPRGPGLAAIGWPMPLGLHLARNTVHVVAQACWAFGLTLLPLATVFALEFTAPAWVALLAVLFLHERMTATRAASIGLGFVGVLV